MSNKDSTRYYSNIQEKKLAKDLGGKQNANSGATDWSKGDVRVDDFLIECKTTLTKKDSFSIKRVWLDKIKEEAIMSNKGHYAVAYNYGPGEDNYIIMEQWMFEEYLELLRKES